MKKGITHSFSTLVSFIRLACFIAKLKISLKCLIKLEIFNNCYV